MVLQREMLQLLMMIHQQLVLLSAGSTVKSFLDRQSRLNLLRREFPKEALVDVGEEDEEVLVVDVVVVTDVVVEMIVVVEAEEEEWKLVLGTGTAHHVET